MNEIEALCEKLKADLKAHIAKTEETVAGLEAVELLDEVITAVKEHISLTS